MSRSGFDSLVLYKTNIDIADCRRKELLQECEIPLPNGTELLARVNTLFACRVCSLEVWLSGLKHLTANEASSNAP